MGDDTHASDRILNLRHGLRIGLLLVFAWAGIVSLATVWLESRSNNATEEVLRNAQGTVEEIADIRIRAALSAAVLEESVSQLRVLQESVEQLQVEVEERTQDLQRVEQDNSQRASLAEDRLETLELNVRTELEATVRAFSNRATELERRFAAVEELSEGTDLIMQTVGAISASIAALYETQQDGSPWRLETRTYRILLSGRGERQYDTGVAVTNYSDAVMSTWHAGGCGNGDSTQQNSQYSVVLDGSQPTWRLGVDNYSDCDELTVRVLFVPLTLGGVVHPVETLGSVQE